MKNKILVLLTSFAFMLGLAATVPASAASGSAPKLTTSAATSATGTTAMLQGTINPNKLSAYWWFQWGTTKSYGTGSPAVLIPAGTTPVSISLVITGLKPSTTYHFRAAGSNARGNNYGGDLTFKTLAVTPPPPPPPPTKTVYLTFDDGPTAGYSTEVLADLNAAGAHATFFEIGKSTYTISGMQNSPTIPPQLLAAGDQLATHSWDHPDFSTLSAAQTASEISQARSYQISLTGHDSKLFRFPYNIVTAKGTAYLNSQGMKSIGNNIDPSDWDWQHVTDAQVISTVMNNVHDGDIVQLHDGQDVLGRDGGHPGYLPALLSQLKAAGYSFGTIPSA